MAVNKFLRFKDKNGTNLGYIKLMDKHFELNLLKDTDASLYGVTNEKDKVLILNKLSKGIKTIAKNREFTAFLIVKDKILSTAFVNKEFETQKLFDKENKKELNSNNFSIKEIKKVNNIKPPFLGFESFNWQKGEKLSDIKSMNLFLEKSVSDLVMAYGHYYYGETETDFALAVPGRFLTEPNPFLNSGIKSLWTPLPSNCKRIGEMGYWIKVFSK